MGTKRIRSSDGGRQLSRRERRRLKRQQAKLKAKRAKKVAAPFESDIFTYTAPKLTHLFSVTSSEDARRHFNGPAVFSPTVPLRDIPGKAHRAFDEIRQRVLAGERAIDQQNYPTAMKNYGRAREGLKQFQPGFQLHGIMVLQMVAELTRAEAMRDAVSSRKMDRFIEAFALMTEAQIMAQMMSIERALEVPTREDTVFEYLAERIALADKARALIKDEFDKLEDSGEGGFSQSMCGELVETALIKYYGDIEGDDAPFGTPREWTRDLVIGDLAAYLKKEPAWVMRKTRDALTVYKSLGLAAAWYLRRRHTPWNVDAAWWESDEDFLRKTRAILTRTRGARAAVEAMGRINGVLFFNTMELAHHFAHRVLGEELLGDRTAREGYAREFFDIAYDCATLILATEPGQEDIQEKRRGVMEKLGMADDPDDVLTPVVRRSGSVPSHELLFERFMEAISTSEGALPSFTQHSETYNELAAATPSLAEALLFYPNVDRDGIRSFLNDVSAPPGLLDDSSDMPTRDAVMRFIEGSAFRGKPEVALLWNLWLDACIGRSTYLEGLDLAPEIAFSPGFAGFTLMRRMICSVAGEGRIDDIPLAHLTVDHLYDAIRCARVMGFDDVEACEACYAFPLLNLDRTNAHLAYTFDQLVDKLRGEDKHVTYGELADLASGHGNIFQEAILLARAGMSLERFGGDSDEALRLYNTSLLRLNIMGRRHDIPWDILKPFRLRVEALRGHLAPAMQGMTPRDLVRRPTAMTSLAGRVWQSPIAMR